MKLIDEHRSAPLKVLPNFGIHISMGGEMGPNEDSSGGDIDKGDEGKRKNEKGCHQNH